MNWPSLRDIVAFRPSVDAVSASPIAEDNYIGAPEEGLTNRPEPHREAAEVRCRRIRFDNAIRLWVAVPTYLTCVALRAGGAIDSILPITAVILAYVGTMAGVFTAFFNLGFTRSADYLLAALDLVAMSFAVYFTGATASPLYFVYFVPVVIHAFHRDWDMILFSGFGGVILYGVAVLVSLSSLSSAAMTDLCARLVFMLLTVAIACLALSVLRKEEERDRLRIARLRAISSLGDCLNRACSASEIAAGCGDMASLISAALSVPDSRAQVLITGFSDAAGPDVRPAALRTEVAIQVDGEASVGALAVFALKGRPLAQDDLRFVRFLAHSIALALRRQQVIQELRHSIEMGTAAAAVYLASGRSARAAQMALVEGAISLLSAERATLYLWNAERTRLEASAWCGGPQPKILSRAVMAGDGLVGMAHLQGVVQSGWGEQLTVDNGARSGRGNALAAPIRLSDGESIGVIAIELESGKFFSEDEAALAAAFACRSAHALLPMISRPAREAPPSTPRLAA